MLRTSLSTLVRRLRAEDGVVIPVTMAVLGIGLLLVAVAASSANFSNDSSNRDRRVKRALQAADAGLAAATYRMNKLDVTRTALPCVASVNGTLTLVNYGVVAGQEWCPAVTEDLGGGASYSYRVSKAVTVTGAQVSLQRTVVSTGTVGGVSRRVATTASALSGTPLFGSNNGMISLDSLALPNSSLVKGNVRSNGNISLTNSAQVQGAATAGPGRTVTLSNNSVVTGSRSAADEPIILSPVNQGNAATVNDNGGICVTDPCTNPSRVSWDPSTRRLSLTNNATVTLGGSVYSFCQVDLRQSSQLIIPPKAAGSSVRIYIDSPENCGGSGGGFTKEQSSTIWNQNTDPTALQLYLVGSDSIATTVSLQNNSTSLATVPIVVYAPRSTVTITNNANFMGGIAAKSIQAQNNTSINLTYASSVGGLISSVFPLYRKYGYRECRSTAPAGSAPDAYC